MTPSDHSWMQRALTLAARGVGKVHPNPPVGCVLVRRNRLIAEGFHRRFGGPHAEIEALRKAGPKARGTTAFVTLEPCSHTGKTPPRAPALIEAGVKRVVVAVKDSNPRVSGCGISQLRRAGVSVTILPPSEAATALIRAHDIRMRLNRPRVILKAAITLDGKIASFNGRSRWISAPSSRAEVHDLRSTSDAVLVGARTVRHDNPALTSHGAGRNPLRIVLDPKRRLRGAWRIFDPSAPTWHVVRGPGRLPQLRSASEGKNLRVLEAPFRKGEFHLRPFLRFLAHQGISQLLVEGGGETFWPFVRDGLFDDIYLWVAPKILGGRAAPTWVEGSGFPSPQRARPIVWRTVQRWGPDLFIHGRPG